MLEIHSGVIVKGWGQLSLIIVDGALRNYSNVQVGGVRMMND